jgi:hypothetical protein
MLRDSFSLIVCQIAAALGGIAGGIVYRLVANEQLDSAIMFSLCSALIGLPGVLATNALQTRFSKLPNLAVSFFAGMVCTAMFFFVPHVIRHPSIRE